MRQTPKCTIEINEAGDYKVFDYREICGRYGCLKRRPHEGLHVSDGPDGITWTNDSGDVVRVGMLKMPPCGHRHGRYGCTPKKCGYSTPAQVAIEAPAQVAIEAPRSAQKGGAPWGDSSPVASSDAAPVDGRKPSAGAPALPFDPKVLGYEGDACSECNAMTLVRNGSCLKCQSCGSTNGCS